MDGDRKSSSLRHVKRVHRRSAKLASPNALAVGHGQPVTAASPSPAIAQLPHVPPQHETAASVLSETRPDANHLQTYPNFRGITVQTTLSTQPLRPDNADPIFQQLIQVSPQIHHTSIDSPDLHRQDSVGAAPEVDPVPQQNIEPQPVGTTDHRPRGLESLGSTSDRGSEAAEDQNLGDNTTVIEQPVIPNSTSHPLCQLCKLQVASIKVCTDCGHVFCAKCANSQVHGPSPSQAALNVVQPLQVTTMHDGVHEAEEIKSDRADDQGSQISQNQDLPRTLARTHVTQEQTPYAINSLDKALEDVGVAEDEAFIADQAAVISSRARENPQLDRAYAARKSKKNHQTPNSALERPFRPSPARSSTRQSLLQSNPFILADRGAQLKASRAPSTRSQSRRHVSSSTEAPFQQDLSCPALHVAERPKRLGKEESSPQDDEQPQDEIGDQEPVSKAVPNSREHDETLPVAQCDGAEHLFPLKTRSGRLVKGKVEAYTQKACELPGSLHPLRKAASANHDLRINEPTNQPSILRQFPMAQGTLSGVTHESPSQGRYTQRNNSRRRKRNPYGDQSASRHEDDRRWRTNAAQTKDQTDYAWNDNQRTPSRLGVRGLEKPLRSRSTEQTPNFNSESGYFHIPELLVKLPSVPSVGGQSGVREADDRLPSDHACLWRERYMNLSSEIVQVGTGAQGARSYMSYVAADDAPDRSRTEVDKESGSNRLGVEGMTIVMHMKGKDDLIIDTDLKMDSSDDDDDQ